MENKLEKKRIVNIVELMDDSQYVIPSYQRGYEWGKEDVYLLLEDLKKYCEKRKRKIVITNFIVFSILHCIKEMEVHTIMWRMVSSV